MKKIIVLLFFVTVLIALTLGNTSGVLIPSDAIRFRIIANSNSLEDQTTKINIRKEIELVFAEILEASTSKVETKELINQNMTRFKDIIEQYKVEYTINYGNNFFPEK